MDPVTIGLASEFGTLRVNTLQSITELLVEMGVKASILSATKAVNKGTVFIEGVRIANKEAMPVIVGRTRVTVEGVDYYVFPRG